jgi:hypothetical protein
MVAEGTSNETGGAVRFFWTWLFLATAVSVAGNVAHAVLTAPPGTVRLAAAAAVVPPAVLLGATHSVALLVKTRRVSFVYWLALAMTFALAGCAFVLSFDALRDLAVALGMAPSRAWLWPVAIDVSIANSTLSLLSLSPPRSAPIAAPATEDANEVHGALIAAESSPTQTAQDVASSPRARAPRDSQSAPRPAPAPSAPSPPPAPSQPDRSRSERVNRPLAAAEAELAGPGDGVDIKQWRPAADELVRDGVTSKDPAIVAAVLAENAAGAAPSTIGRRHNLHHSTVGRIVAGAQHRGLFNRRIVGEPVLSGVDLSESPAAC